MAVKSLLFGRLALKGVEIIPGRGKGQANWHLGPGFSVVLPLWSGAGQPAWCSTANGGSCSSRSRASGSPLAWGMGQGGERGEENNQPDNPDPSVLCKARQTFWKTEYFEEAWRGWRAEIVLLVAAGNREGTTGRRWWRMEEGGRSSPCCWLNSYVSWLSARPGDLR